MKLCGLLILLLKILKENNQNGTRVEVALMFVNKPQSLSTPSDFSEYTITNFPGYETQQ